MNNSGQLDKQKALQWLEGDEQMLAKIKAIFLKNIPSQVKQLKILLDTGDIATAERVAHTIMGSSAMLGASGMSEKAREIEQCAIKGDTHSAQRYYAHFIGEYEKVMAELVAEGGK